MPSMFPISMPNWQQLYIHSELSSEANYSIDIMKYPNVTLASTDDRKSTWDLDPVPDSYTCTD